jgi:hypothetical protein
MIRDSDLCTGRYCFSSPKCPERLWGPPISYSFGNGGASPLVSDRGVRLTTYRLALPSLRMSRSIPPLPKYAFMTCAGKTLLWYINPLEIGVGGNAEKGATFFSIGGRDQKISLFWKFPGTACLSFWYVDWKHVKAWWEVKKVAWWEVNCLLLTWIMFKESAYTAQ